MELRHLRYFVAVAEELNFTRASERLHTAQPSLSQQIRDLEDAVGTPLLFRTKRHVALTDAGKVFLAEARVVLAQVERGILMARRAARAEAGQLVIGFVPSAEVKIFPKVLPVLRARYPDVQVVLHSMSTPEQRAALLDNSINIGFFRANHREPRLEERIVLKEPLVAVLPVGHPLEKLPIVPFALFQEYPFVGISAEEAPELAAAVAQLSEANGVELEVVQSGENVLMILSLVAMGLGIAILPDYVESLLIKNVICRPIEGNPMFDLVMGFRRDDHSAVLESFCALVGEVIERTNL
ncbi:MAG: LysR substrate-binding domain-containing protein [Acidobacteriota bacterium]|nr:LysR substrate-binding domain-containing protein [Acidobacteriota bacterium]